MSNLPAGTVIYEWVNDYDTPTSVYTTNLSPQYNDILYNIYGEEIGIMRYLEISSPYVYLYTLINSYESNYERSMDDSTSTTVQIKINYISQLSDGTNTYTIKDAEARNSLTGKQDTLVSGTNIKTINNNSILGSGNISVETSIDNTTITKNGSNNLQSVATIDNRSGNAIKTWTGTRAQYDAIIAKDSNTLYNITDDTSVTLSLLEILYPVGSIYITTNNTCPLSTLISGSTWVQETTRISVDKKVPTSEDQTWYNLYSDGWCEQGGAYTQTFENAWITVNLLKEYTDTNYNIMATGNCTSTTTNYPISTRQSTKTVTSFDVGSTANYGSGFYWSACGYTSTTTNHKQFRRTA